jgi:hypothetical protein
MHAKPCAWQHKRGILSWDASAGWAGSGTGNGTGAVCLTVFDVVGNPHGCGFDVVGNPHGRGFDIVGNPHG